MASIFRTPRSVSDATRFTPTTPHAASKAPAAGTPPASASSSAPSRFSNPSSSSRLGPAPPGSGRRAPASGGQPGGGGGGGAPAGVAETPEQRVARLRAAHLAARNAQVSTFDRVANSARGFFDKAHRVTTMGLLGLTAIAGLLTVYAAFDMITFNRKRRAEFIEAQKRIHADSLEAARLAYMRGDATEEQIALVDEANARAEGLHFPSLLGAPAPLQRQQQQGESSSSDGSVSAAASSAWTATREAGSEETASAAEASKAAGWGSGIKGYFEGQKKADVPGHGVVKTVGDKARAAFDKERENQLKGGPLDQVGTTPAPQPDKKKGWW